MKIVFVVKTVDNKGELVTGYVGQTLDMPFVPTVGMKFKMGISTWLWETDKGELDLPVKEIVYNLDDEIVYCLFEYEFERGKELKHSFWKEVKNVYNSYELMQFKSRQ
ncbi:hypothetical protein NST17_19505 [Caldifermentibacillus hisashii]|uniref:Uncharacterized protein n=1 Tax=Caldifermentibacillus hisashii TaxID=996558 RepID=A0ABU9K3G4_9BACI